MLIPDQDARRQITADQIERLADDYARANSRHNQREKLATEAGHSTRAGKAGAALGDTAATGKLIGRVPRRLGGH